MSKNQPKSQTSENSLRSISEQSVNYLDLAEESCLRFQTEIRKHGIKTFNVWKYLESEFKKAYAKEGIEHRQPPRASTISQWFDPDPISGTKMGTEDLRLICKIVNDPTPIMAYYEQSLEPFEEESPESLLFDLKKLTSDILNLTNFNGHLCKDFNSSIQDDILTKEETIRLKSDAKRIIDQASKIIFSLENRKG